MSDQQGLRQASVRAVTGTALDYNGDFASLFTLKGIPAGDFNGRMLGWINLYLNASYDNLPGAMAAFAIANGATNFSAIGTFDASLGGAPANTVLPAISGTPSQGQTLSCSTGTWTNSPTSYAYQWKADGASIGGATASTYLLTATEVGKAIACAVAATNAAGNATATSLATAAVSGLGTLNPLDKDSRITLSNGNLTGTKITDSAWVSGRSQTSHSSGKYYYEWTPNAFASYQGAGFANATATTGNFIGTDANGIMYLTDGEIFKGAGGSFVMPAMVAGNTACFAIDLTNHLFWCRKGSGTWNNSGTADPATGVGGIALPTGLNSGAVFAGLSLQSATDNGTVNFGASAFSQTSPSGYSAWG